jgi:hypothetical protein
MPAFAGMSGKSITISSAHRVAAAVNFCTRRPKPTSAV